MFNSFLFDDSIFFRRPFLEKDGYAVKEKDGKLVLKINVVGLGKDDLEIKILPTNNPDHQMLVVKGEREDELFGKFQINNRFYLHRQAKNIESSIDKGILTLEVEFQEPVVPDVQVKWLTG